MSDKQTRLGIPEVLKSLREDLDRAQSMLAKSGDQPLLKLDSAEIELSVSITQSSDTEGKVGINVLGVNIGAGGKDTEAIQNTHKIKISMTPTGTVGVAGKQLS
jgi:hypothetical protein